MDRTKLLSVLEPEIGELIKHSEEPNYNEPQLSNEAAILLSVAVSMKKMVERLNNIDEHLEHLRRRGMPA